MSYFLLHPGVLKVGKCALWHISRGFPVFLLPESPHAVWYTACGSMSDNPSSKPAPEQSGASWRRPKNGNKGYGKWGKFHTLSFIFCRPRLLKWQKRLGVSAANTECWWTRLFYCRNRLSAYGIRFTSRCPTILHPNLRPNSPGHLGRRPKNDTVCRKGAKKRGKSSKILQKRRQKN